jgi:hypothetical protein
MRKGDGIIRAAVSAQSTSSRTSWKCAREMESSERQSVLNQQVHVQTVNARGRWNHQSGSQCSINKFTYILEMRKGDGIIRAAVSAQSTSSRTDWKCAREMESSERQSVLNQQVHVHTVNAQGRWNHQSGSQCSINKFTHRLEMRKGDGIIRAAVSAQSTSSRTNCKCAREMESSERQSVLNQQVHIHPGNARGRWNHQSGSQCSINKFTYRLEMRKGDGIVRAAVSAQSTSSRTAWKCAREMESSEQQSVLNQQVHVHTVNAQGRWNHQSGSQCSINKFTHRLEMRKGDGIIRAAVSAQSTSSRTNCKCAREMESSERQSVLNQQVHVHPGNAQGRQNCQNTPNA